MKSLPKVLIFGFAGLVALALFGLLLTSTITYLPYGVPKSRLQEYDQKVKEIKRYAEAAKNADITASPVVSISKKTFDFGMVDPHTTLSHEFAVRNEGELPLELAVKKTSCKCTIGKLKNSIVLPGEETVITMTWNTGYQADEYKQVAFVTTNDPLQKSLELTVKGEVRAQFVVPEQIAFNTTDPGKLSEASFIAYSQLWDDFAIQKIQSELKGFDWVVEPIDLDDVALADREAKSAWRVKVSSLGNKRGKFSGVMKLVVEPSDGSEVIEREIAAEGKVRAPINFYSPDIHPRDGMNIGTLVSDKEHEFHLIVRARSEDKRDIEVLDVEPKIVKADLVALSQPGSYRLTLRVPKGSPLMIFNRETEHGYVHVGDPKDDTFSNWFPLLGAVVTPED